MGVTIRERTRKDGRTSLYLDIFHEGQRSYDFLKIYLTGNKEDDKQAIKFAETARAMCEAELFAETRGLVSPFRGKMSLYDYARQKSADRDKKDPLVKSLKYIQDYFGATQLKSISSERMEGYQSFLKNQSVKSQLTDHGDDAPPTLPEKKLMSSTVANYFNALNAVLNTAVRERILVVNPARAVKRMKVQESIQEYLTIEELELLARTPIMGEDGLGGEIKRAFLFSCLANLRLSDIKTLTWGEVQNGKIEKRMRKTSKIVVMPLSIGALELIKDDKVHPHSAKVFNLTDTDPNQYIKKWAKAAGISKRVHFHTSRHTFGTQALEGGADVFTVQKLLGHSSSRQTQRYAAITDRSKKAAVDGIKVDFGRKKNA